jgi:uncharacterized membrane protein
MSALVADGAKASRVVAIDWMRGFVMVLMAIDHVSLMFNPGRVAADSAWAYKAGSALPADQFLTRWITHLCAPTFLFLAGTAIALSTARRAERGMEPWAIDRDLLIRGAIIALLDITYMSTLAGMTLLQVLYAIGVSMMLMVPLRRLRPRTLLALSLLIIGGAEALTSQLWLPSQGVPPLPLALTPAPQFAPGFVVPYPAIPWLGIMMLGWAFGMHMNDGGDIKRTLVVAGLGGLALFLVVRGFNGYGNMHLLREDNSIVQWLHVSKYPPCLAFAALELGLMALIMRGLIDLHAWLGHRDKGPILVFGQTALFFYLAHFASVRAARFGSFPGKPSGTLVTVYGGALVLLVALYPLCLAYRKAKRRWPQSVLRFI